MDDSDTLHFMCPCCNLPLEFVAGIFMCLEGGLTIISANCIQCVFKWRKLPKTARYRMTRSAGKKAFSSPEQYPCIYFESALHAKLAYRLLEEATPEKRMEFFAKQSS